MRTLFLFVLLLVKPVWLLGFAIDLGEDRRTVNMAYGAPRSKAVKGDVESWYYAEGSVVFVGGKVSEINFKGREPQFRKAVLPSAPVMSATPSNATSQAPTQVGVPFPVRPSVAASPPPVSLPLPTQDPVEPITSGLLMMLGVLGLFGLLSIAAAWLFRWKATPGLPGKLLQSSAQSKKPQATAIATTKTPLSAAPPVRSLTKETLDLLEWRRVEELTELYFGRTGWSARRSAVGADGGVDILLQKEGSSKPEACVQCKQRSNELIGVRYLREFYGVMISSGFEQGFYVTTSCFTSDAIEFAKGKTITLIDRDELVLRVNALPETVAAEVVAQVFRDDYRTPTCPSCDVKLVLRSSAQPFWGCSNYPRCRTKIYVSKVALGR